LDVVQQGNGGAVVALDAGGDVVRLHGRLLAAWRIESSLFWQGVACFARCAGAVKMRQCFPLIRDSLTLFSSPSP
jgi:hypothetical protein